MKEDKAMRGNLSEFTSKVNKACKTVLKEYRPEIELALGPAKLTVRPVKVQTQEKEEELSL